MSWNRRSFLQHTLGASALVSLGAAAPTFLCQASAQAAESGGEKILVVVQLSGGNDGLNTVVPYGDDAYYRNRFTLAQDRGGLHRVDDYCGLHSAMRGCADLLDEDALAIVQGVGYPNPNRSHFESMDIWHTCQRETSHRSRGWLGQWLDQTQSSAQHAVAALHLGSEKQPLALAAAESAAVSIDSLDRFRLATGPFEGLPEVIAANAGERRQEPSDLLAFAQQSTTTALASSRQVEEAVGANGGDIRYPQTPLGTKLRTVGRMIRAELPTRIYYVTLDGFDTHSNQADAHAGLLRQFSDAVAAFTRDMKSQGDQDRVLLLAFSEFGRRVKENASRGTDHGAANPVFLAGGGVRSGLIGRHPSLTDLDDGDLKFHTDFRRVYAALLGTWLGAPRHADILGGPFEPLPLWT